MMEDEKKEMKKIMTVVMEINLIMMIMISTGLVQDATYANAYGRQIWSRQII